MTFQTPETKFKVYLKTKHARIVESAPAKMQLLITYFLASFFSTSAIFFSLDKCRRAEEDAQGPKVLG